MMEFLDTEISIAWACLAIVIIYVIADICKIGSDEYEAHKAKREKE